MNGIDNLNFRQEIKHRMGRRCSSWDYSACRIYMITVTQENRKVPLLGHLVSSGNDNWYVEPTDLGKIVEECWKKIPIQWPGVELIINKLMPDHFHGILHIKHLPENKTLGNVIGSFKTRSTSLANIDKLWAPSFVDTILFRETQLKKMIKYVLENPRRLGIKRKNPNLFRIVQEIEVDFAARDEAHNPGAVKDSTSCCIQPWMGPRSGSFSAIGNVFLLSNPTIVQIQCSRSLFAYKCEQVRGGGYKILRNNIGDPICAYSTKEFEDKAAKLLAAGLKGAVLLCPCISHGEREIARRAFNAGCQIIILRNKGFSPFYKPEGKLFNACSSGKLLLLAPKAWNYVPGEKPITRENAQVMNRIAQLICKEDAVEIDYKGVELKGIDEKVVFVTTADAV